MTVNVSPCRELHEKGYQTTGGTPGVSQEDRDQGQCRKSCDRIGILVYEVFVLFR